MLSEAILVRALESIAANTCCDTCQEAALVAREALNAARAEPPETTGFIEPLDEPRPARATGEWADVWKRAEPPVREEGEVLAWAAIAHPETGMGTIVGCSPANVERDADELYGPGHYDLIALSRPSPPLDGPSRASLQNMQTTPSREEIVTILEDCMSACAEDACDDSPGNGVRLVIIGGHEEAASAILSLMTGGRRGR